MQFNLPLHNNMDIIRRQRTNPRRTITVNNPKLKTHHLLPKNNHNGSLNSHVLFLVMITTLKTFHNGSHAYSSFSLVEIYGFSNPLSRG
jgi:hypothetical protein